MRFEFATAARILFGAGTLQQVPSAAREMGSRALVVTGRSPERAAPLLDLLRPAALFAIPDEPTIELVRNGAAIAREHDCDFVVGFGGGSAIDGGKAIAALLTNPGDPLDYLEIVGAGNALEHPSAPFIAIPTTAGTGSEVTRNAVLGSQEHRVKASLRSPHMLPRLAIVDPDLTLDLPPALTASTGLDALTQLIEPYVSIRANLMTDMFCVEGLRRVAQSLVRAYTDGRDSHARTDMAFASLLGGLSLANAGLGVVHGFAAPIGGMFRAPHGAICAAVLPYGMEENIRALRSKDPDGSALRRYGTVAQILTGDPAATPERGVGWVRETCRKLNIPPLRTYGVSAAEVATVIDKAANASSMKANPIPLTPQDLHNVITKAL